MGRNRSYNEDAVLTGAMQAFRRKGYQALSIRDLEEATGLKAGSIYNSFKDKAGLFDAAFRHYNHTVLGGRIAQFAPASTGLKGLRDLFVSLLHEPDETSFGCLITNTAVELAGESAPHHCVGEGLQVLTRTFSDRLIAAGYAGETAQNAAVRLLTLYQGILVLMRAGHEKPALERLILDEFDNLGRDHDT